MKGSADEVNERPDRVRHRSEGQMTFVQGVEAALPVAVQLRLFAVDGADLAAGRPDRVA